MALLRTLHDTICCYCFWTNFYALGAMIWFYPLNELDITGYEAFAAIWIIPVVLFIPIVRRGIFSEIGVRLLEVGMLIGIASFQMSTTLLRLQVLSVAGNGCAILYLCARLFSGTGLERAKNGWMFLGSNLLFLASRVPYTSIVPAWADFKSNWIVISVLATSIATQRVLQTLKKLSTKPKPAVEQKQKSAGASTTTAQKTKVTTAPAIVGSPSFLIQILIGLFFGSLLFTTHWVFGELSVLSRWTVTGATHPPSLFSPFWTSPVVLLALCAGAYLTTSFPKIFTSLNCWIFGTAAFFGTYFVDGSLGFICGLILAVYCSSLWVISFRKVSVCHPGALTLSMITYAAQNFFHVWTVAYNFVPGGVYTRERTDALIGFNCLTTLIAFRKSGVLPHKADRPKSFTAMVVLALLVTGISSFGRLPLQPKGKDVNPETRDFSAAIWTYHFGYDNRGWPSLERSAELLNETGADVIALLESDASKPYLGLNDLGMWLSEKLGMFVDFGPATKDHTWGNLLLSKYPIVNSRHHLLPSPHGELAPAISATLNISGSLVDIVSTHMGNDRDVLDRELQTKYLSNLAAKSPNPVVFLGYVTSKPFSRDYNHFRDKGLLKDIDSTDKQRFCEYILYKKLIRQGYARISHGGLSDTEVQLAKFSIPEDTRDYEDNEVIETNPENVETWKRFSGKFGGFTPGHYSPWEHHYHMSTPKYFVKSTNKNSGN